MAMVLGRESSMLSMQVGCAEILPQVGVPVADVLEERRSIRSAQFGRREGGVLLGTEMDEKGGHRLERAREVGELLENAVRRMSRYLKRRGALEPKDDAEPDEGGLEASAVSRRGRNSSSPHPQDVSARSVHL
jgi:hypothetical protein